MQPTDPIPSVNSDPKSEPNTNRKSNQRHQHRRKSRLVFAGALAYDTIARTSQILGNADASRHNLKLSELKYALGGCAGNLAYTANLLGEPSLLLSTLGELDAAEYLAHLTQQDLPTHGILELPGNSARGTVITDPNNDQFIAFYPGAPVNTELNPQQWHQHLQHVDEDIRHCQVFVQAAFDPMLTRHSIDWIKQYSTALIVWSPGQYVEAMNHDQLKHIVPQVDWIVGNAHEIDYLNQSIQLDNIANVIRTDGAGDVNVSLCRGDVHPKKIVVQTPTAPTQTDPTGCGDAFLATFAHGLLNESSSFVHSNNPPDHQRIKQLVQFATRQAQQCLAQHGAQAHQLLNESANI